MHERATDDPDILRFREELAKRRAEGEIEAPAPTRPAKAAWNRRTEAGRFYRACRGYLCND